MEATAIIAILTQIIALLPALIAAGVQIEGLVARVTAAVNSGSTDPTDAQWQAVNAELDALTAQLNKDPAAPASSG
jgi:hypothetical protein